MSNKFLIGFGAVATLAGLYLAYSGNHFIGLFGAITGLFLVFLGVKSAKK